MSETDENLSLHGADVLMGEKINKNHNNYK